MEKTTFRQTIWSSIVFLFFFSVLLGLAYPGFITLILQMTFHDKANGSLIILDNQIQGSWLIGQSFTQEQHFWGRPSVLEKPSNFNPTNPKQHDLIKERVNKLIASSANSSSMIPIDLVTASASGLDPDISVASALYQIPRIAKARNLDEKIIQEIVLENASTLGLLSPPHVNVLKLNTALDKVNRKHHGNSKT
ncbi:potassium-transporting ATPase subunit KdpC [Candidatus Berkiella aquae]|uniref:Potassium-transporting ATPase KdpC subunit n=1 Tax=Candidatus Berkiella aquae TaxID=295108 RepID=A0A0Q9YNU4_9GAMM|nr:potassium-transporting ATPase subunit KdpC [Candidatus Berkiella aquae]MCS5712355.1 potassium-transporting ATPase subunit KdpC [Candidatus Berkiella aquae]